MDLLKAELERKRRALTAASGGGGDNNTSSNKKKKYLTAAERRRLEEEEEERQEELEREERRRRKKKKKRKRDKKGNGGDSEDDEKEEEDLTTLLTKKYDPKKKKIDAANTATYVGDSNKQDDKIGGTNINSDGDTKENQTSKAADNNNNDGTIIIPESLQKLTPDEVTNTLRNYGLPIRLFGERTIISSSTTSTNNDNADKKTSIDDTARLQRLAIATQGREAALLRENEDDEFLLDSANRTRNVFLKGKHNEEDDDDNAGHAKSPTKSTGDTPSSSAAKTPTKSTELTEEEKNDKPKRIYRYFKNLIRQWEDDLSHRPDTVKRTAAGKNETKTLKQCKDYIRPLFQLCKRRELEEGLQLHLFNIVTYCEIGEFVKAHDAYMDVAIGRAAWPIGVTMVGIHARSGRAKIESSNVAHVMNSELHRKYLTSVKRLMRYDQNKRTDVAPSKKVMNI